MTASLSICQSWVLKHVGDDFVFFRCRKRPPLALRLYGNVRLLHSCSPAPTGGSGICRKWRQTFLFPWCIPPCATIDSVVRRSLPVSGKSRLASCDGECAVVSGTQLLRSARHLCKLMLLLRSELPIGLSSTSAFLLQSKCFLSKSAERKRLVRLCRHTLVAKWKEQAFIVSYVHL